MVMPIRTLSSWQSLGLLTLCLMLTHCSHDIHEKRASTVKKTMLKPFTIT